VGAGAAFDSREDDFWCAAQLHKHYWEQSQFFGSSEPGGAGYATEAGNFRLPAADYAAADAVAADIAAARQLLRILDKACWHELAYEALGVPRSGHILALVFQFDQLWLHCSNPWGGDHDGIYAVKPDGLAFVVRHQDRFDELAGSVELIRGSGASDEALAAVSPAARAQLGNAVRDPSAARALSGLMRQASAAVRAAFADVPRHPDAAPEPRVAFEVRPRSTERARYRWPNRVGKHFIYDMFVVDYIYYDRTQRTRARHADERVPGATDYLERLELYPFERIEAAIRTIDGEKLRQLFEQATGIDTFDDHELRFLDDGRDSYLLYRDVLFRAADEGMVVAGPCASAGIDAGFRDWIGAIDRGFYQRSGNFYWSGPG
jgi:hypothetical protein